MDVLIHVLPDVLSLERDRSYFETGPSSAKPPLQGAPCPRDAAMASVSLRHARNRVAADLAPETPSATPTQWPLRQPDGLAWTNSRGLRDLSIGSGPLLAMPVVSAPGA